MSKRTIANISGGAEDRGVAFIESRFNCNKFTNGLIRGGQGNLLDSEMWIVLYSSSDLIILMQPVCMKYQTLASQRTYFKVHLNGSEVSNTVSFTARPGLRVTNADVQCHTWQFTESGWDANVPKRVMDILIPKFRECKGKTLTMCFCDTKRRKFCREYGGFSSGSSVTLKL
jgi:hypothetical protein